MFFHVGLESGLAALRTQHSLTQRVTVGLVNVLSPQGVVFKELGAVLAPADKLAPMHLLDMFLMFRPSVKGDARTLRAPVVVEPASALDVLRVLARLFEGLAATDADLAVLLGLGGSSQRVLVDVLDMVFKDAKLVGRELFVADVTRQRLVAVLAAVVGFKLVSGAELFVTRTAGPGVFFAAGFGSMPSNMLLIPGNFLK